MTQRYGLPKAVTGLVGFLRGGYPHGAPDHGYVPLLALMPTTALDGVKPRRD